MGELLPCPFCGFRMIASDALRTRNRTVYVHEAHEGECPAMNVIIHSDNQARITAWNTRPRTEGRGEQKVHQAIFISALPGCDEHNAVVGPEPGADDDTPYWTLIAQGGEETQNAIAAEICRRWNSSPIREPEISRNKRDEIEKLLRENLPATCGLHCQREQTQAEEDAAYRYTADAILNLAPVGGRGEEGSARADLSPASRSPEPAPHWIDGRRFSEHAGERWRHVKRGSVYSLPFGRAEAMVQCAEPITDEGVLTIYIGEGGMIFARPTHEFHDGRFALLPDERGLSGAQRSELLRSAPDEQNPSHNEESQTNGS